VTPEVMANRFAELREARRNLRRTIKKAKMKAWRELLATLEADPWGRPYKIVFKKVQEGSRCPGLRGAPSGLYE